MSGWIILIALALTVGVGLLVVEQRRTGHPEDIDFGALGRGVLIALVIVLALVVLLYLVERAVMYHLDECEWSL